MKWLVLCCLGLSCHAATLYVAPNGRDSWSGRLAKPNTAQTDGPLASLTAARDALRRVPATQSRRVVIAGGSYFLREPLILTPQDSGTAQNPTIFEAAPGAKPIFSGGQAIKGFRRNADGTWSTSVTGQFEQLFVNDQRATRARTPNQGYLYVQAKSTVGIDPLTGQPADLSSRAFRAKTGDLNSLPTKLPDLQQAVVVVYHSWEVSRLPVAGVDLNSNTLIAVGGMSWPFFYWGANQRYHLENYRAALDRPGEWFLDRQGLLTYYPRPGEDMTRAEVIAPRTEQFITITGTPSQKVQFVRIAGLSFQHGQYRQPSYGYSSGQAAYWIGAVVEANFAEHIRLEKNEIAHIGNYGIWFKQGCTDCQAVGNYLHDLGGGGIKIGDWKDPQPNEYTSNNLVDNNIIRGGGRIFFGAVGIWIGHSGDNKITHNDISDLNYSGISAGWRWTYDPSLAKRNQISFNRIHDVGRGVLNDLGGIYTLGPSEGTVINNNVIYNVYSFGSYGRGGWGIYNDQSTVGVTMENNLVYDVMNGSYNLHYGRDLMVRNNILATSEDGQLQVASLAKDLSVTLNKNIIFWQKSDLLVGPWDQINAQFSNNLYYKTSGPISFLGRSLTDWQGLGKDRGSINADPRFINVAKKDFRLRSDSPALKLGFKPFDPSQAGVYGSKAWVTLARPVALPPISR